MSDGTPFVGFSNDTLGKLPTARRGMLIDCPHCGGSHELQCAKDGNGDPTDLLHFFKCGEQAYIGAVAGRLVVGTPSDVSGTVEGEGDEC